MKLRGTGGMRERRGRVMRERREVREEVKRKVGGNGRENENFKKASLKAQTFYRILGERGWSEELVQMLPKKLKKIWTFVFKIL